MMPPPREAATLRTPKNMHVDFFRTPQDASPAVLAPPRRNSKRTMRRGAIAKARLAVNHPRVPLARAAKPSLVKLAVWGTHIVEPQLNSPR